MLILESKQNLYRADAPAQAQKTLDQLMSDSRPPLS
jgi:hypothetical protein